jgi:threonine dehydrogenase-like Zn-dependent dehydrogenase
LREGKIDLMPVISHRLPLERFDEAMALLDAGEANKILLTVKR